MTDSKYKLYERVIIRVELSFGGIYEIVGEIEEIYKKKDGNLWENAGYSYGIGVNKYSDLLVVWEMEIWRAHQ